MFRSNEWKSNSYLHLSYETCCSVCWRNARRREQVWWSESWPSGSEPAFCHCSETWIRGSGTSLVVPQGTRACRMLQRGSLQDDKKKRTFKYCWESLVPDSRPKRTQHQGERCERHHGSMSSSTEALRHQLVLHDNLPEEGVVLHTDLPEPFGSTMIGKLETDRALKLLKLRLKKKKKKNLWAETHKSIFTPCTRLCYHLAGSDFDVEVIPLVRNLEYFRPSKPVDPQPVSVDKKATCTNSQHNLYSLGVLERTHTKDNSWSGVAAPIRNTD